MWIQFVLLAIGFVLLIWGAHLLVAGASALARRFQISDIVIGLTIVAFGTSAPELVVNVMASLKGSSDIVLGNVVGSNLFNVMVILGLAAIIKPLTVKSTTTWIEIPMAFAVAVILILLSSGLFLYAREDASIGLWDSLWLLVLFGGFLIYNFYQARKGDSGEAIEVKALTPGRIVFFVILGLAFLVGGGRFVVMAAVDVARDFGVSERIIALTIVSVGTSLPELATSIVATFRGNTDIAIGNVVGSNIFNGLFILGSSALILPVPVPADAMADLWLHLAVSLVLFVFVFTGRGRRIDRWEGFLLVAAYVVYLYFLLKA